VRILINLVLFLLVTGAFVLWLRPYWGRWKRTYQSVRNTLRFVRQVCDTAKNGGGFRVPTDFGQARDSTGFGQARDSTGFGQARDSTGFGQARDSTGFGQARDGAGFRQARGRNDKTVDVTPKMSLKVGCPVCKEMLSSAQLEALRQCQLRCPAMQQGASCPYYGKALN
jgi:hypothetical protein